jgi:phosphohistidine swiveling domain-containing protein
MEAWMEPMERRYGRPWPTTVLIYNNDIVGWYNKWVELLDYGQYLIDLFIRKDKRAELEHEISTVSNHLNQMFKQLSEKNFRELSDSDLIKIYNQIRHGWMEWFVPGGLVEPIGHQGEKLLEKKLEGNPDASKIISLVTTTTRESFSKRELSELLGILIDKKEGKDIDKALEIHARKYYWLHNNYFTTEVLDYQFFLNELKILEEKYPNPADKLRAMENELLQAQKEKERIMKELNFGAKEYALVELLDLFAWYQDYRKEYIMQLLHYLDMVLGEIAARKRISLKEMKYSLPSEIQAIMGGQFDKKILQERMKRCLFYWDADTEKAEFGMGQFAIDKEKEIFHSLKHKEEILEVTGMAASKGFVRGQARITLSAKAATEIKPGEILITSMTTPDFVTAVKRAAAVVTNEGGVLCHAAVISREFGIPCIVGTMIATKVFKTGDMLEVDANSGIVRKIASK